LKGADAAGRVALVTGASRGIGRAICQRLHADGAAVIGIARTPIDAPGVIAIAADLEDLDAIPSIVEDINREVGPIDILVNNAGIYRETTTLGLSWEDYRRVLAINLDAPIALMAATCSGMAERNWGRVVTIGSVHGDRSEPRSLAYNVAKAGVHQATRTFGVELAPKGVLANVVAPGFVATDMSIVNGENELETDWFRTIYQRHGKLPLGRAALPEEIAGITAWLASGENTYLTGQVVTIDGGLTAIF
jgi:NAD(P)-dependent dehydrogenase (short-subunit alcohol dehydrogenase family)